MSITSAIQTLTNTIRGIASTKQDIKTAVNTDYEAINNEQIEQYPNLIRNAINQYKSYIPKVTGEGKQLSLNTVPLKAKEFAVIGDTFQQSYTGKNLFDYSTNIIEGALLNGTNMIVARATGVNLSYIQCKPNTTYTISRTASPRSTRFQVATTENTPAISEPLLSYNASNTTTANSITITTAANANYIVVRFIYDEINDYETYAKTIQIEEGSTATDYEPYVGGTASPNPDYPQDIQVVTGEQTVVKRGKNLYSGNDTVSQKHTYFLDCKIGETYTLSFKAKTTSRNRVFLRTALDKTDPSSATDSTQVYVEDTETLNSYTLTLTSTINGYLFMSLAGGTSTYTFEQIMLETGSTATDYEPYNGVELPLNLGNMELCKIGEYKDILFKNTADSEFYNSELEEGSWYKKKTIRKIICDGTETVTKSNVTGAVNTQRFRLGAYNNNFVTINAFCDKFIIKTPDIRIGDFEFLQIGGTPTVFLYININLNRLTENTITAFKAWLSNNNVTAYCILAEPISEQITDTTLINQLEAIEQTNMNNGTTIIYAENEEGLQPTLYVKAYTNDTQLLGGAY